MLFDIIIFVIDKLIKWIVIPAVLIYIGYLLTPLFFKYLIAPKFNAAYKYSKKDFIITEQTKLALEIQENIPKLTVDKKTGLYSISFGKVRILHEGFVGVNSNNIWYSNKKSLLPIKNQKQLVLKDSKEGNGKNKLGEYKTVALNFQLEGLKSRVQAIFQIYTKKSFMTFELSFPDGIENTSRDKFENQISSFPNFQNNSPNQNILTWRNAIFSPPERNLIGTTAPVVFYDDELNVFILSPLDGFMNALISKDKTDQIHCGIQGEVINIPKGYSQKFILYFGKEINQSMMDLGELLYKYHGTSRSDMYRNICLQKIGFWTDNGAHYYYNPIKGVGFDGTLLLIDYHFKQHDIPIGYYNLDSWWYVKKTPPKWIRTILKPIFRLTGGGLYGNIILWETDPKWFKTDLKSFHEHINTPFTAHSRRWHAKSPYLEKFEFVTYKDHAVPVNKDFWDYIMKFAKESGIEVYEQDWMKTQMNSIPQLRQEMGLAEKWLESMALAAADHDVDVFHCMSTPAMCLFSIKHQNISFTRCSNDYNARWPKAYKVPFTTQTNILLNAVGLWPHDDCFRSSNAGIVYREKYPTLKALIQILTAGLVAPSDRMDKVDRELLLKTCRDDGVLLKPDRAITANDLMFKKHAKYYICDTWTKKNDLMWRYFLILNLWPSRVKDRELRLEEVGIEDNEFVLYDYFSGDAQPFAKDKVMSINLKSMQFKYYILVPILSNGMALIGDPDKFVVCSNKQFPQVEASGNSITFEVEDVKDSSLNILIYSPKKPKSVKIENKNAKSWNYNAEKKIINIQIDFKADAIKTITIA